MAVAGPMLEILTAHTCCGTLSQLGYNVGPAKGSFLRKMDSYKALSQPQIQV